MARLLALLVVASAVAPSLARDWPTGKNSINDADWIDFLNHQNNTWVAGPNDFFEGFLFDDARGLLGTDLQDISTFSDKCLPDSAYAAHADAIPDEFDARTKWPGLIHPIRDQQRCGSCWAFSAAEVFGDRVAIASGKPSPVLSPEELVSCDKGDMGCHGGRLHSAWEFIEQSGLVPEACFPYSAGQGTAPQCTRACKDGESFDSSAVKAKTAYPISGVQNMQIEIMQNGPIQVAFKVYKSFMSYKSGVYQKHFWEILPEGGHAVKILGWGTEGGVPYWLVANSWNTSWGMDGFFKIKRGGNQCGIETMGPPYAGMPAASSDGELLV